MSWRSLLEFNHDYHIGDPAAFGEAIRDYLRTADPRCLPPGVVMKNFRHHSDPDPMTGPPPPKREIAEALRDIVCRENTANFDAKLLAAADELDRLHALCQTLDVDTPPL